MDFKKLMEETIISQYGNSPHIQGLIEAFCKQIDPTADIGTFYKKVFDPRTAEGFGLDIWGDIVGVIRYIKTNANNGWLGMFGQGAQNFDNAPFYNEGVTSTYVLSDNAFRELIFLKAYANISTATMPDVKYVLNALIGKATAYKAGEMKLRILLFSYEIPPSTFGLIRTHGFMNLGAGVGFEYYIIDPSLTFGFDGGGWANFDNGIFEPYEIYQMDK